MKKKCLCGHAEPDSYIEGESFTAIFVVTDANLDTEHDYGQSYKYIKTEQARLWVCPKCQTVQYHKQ